ncbi:MAG: radical SAM protein [Nitrospirae bacterium GWC2_42_7]|nr:MAG: radical SAM protein [Nitrospirae bacterium GWC2_42_7]
MSSKTYPHLIDTHCHLDMKEFDSDRDEVIRRSKDSGIETMITVSSDPESISKCIELSEKYDFIYASVGVHPHDAIKFNEKIYGQLRELAFSGQVLGLNAQETSSLLTPHSSLNKVVAIGETGLDYHYDHSPRKIQQEVFIRHLHLAKESGLPAIIHSRESATDTLRILRESGINKGVMHCFSGDLSMAEEVMSMGLYISIAGPVTFKKSLKLKEVAASIPDDYLLIETDAPYLSPEPYRGKRNEPSFIQSTAKHIAELRGVNFEDIARITTLNAKRLFSIGVIPEKAEIAYKIRDSLYLNITNRCTNRCSFCVKFRSDYVKGHRLSLANEPSEDEIKKEIGDPTSYKEIVFCGYGEPLQRLDTVKNISGWIKEKGGRVRINTNGHANLIHKKNVLPELQGLVDSISISLDAHDEETYNKICKPLFKNAFNEVIRFIKQAKEVIPDVQVTIVELEGVDTEKCRKLADSLGVKIRVRRFNAVG